LGFSFFLPTLAVGPISPYAQFRSSIISSNLRERNLSLAGLRIVVGLTQYYFLANIFNQLSYNGLILDGYSHQPIDLLIASVSYYLYIYFNFCGFCDIAIGASGLLGIDIQENFNFPLSARNLREFWNRWHITLSTFMRDLVFAPMSQAILRKTGPEFTQNAVAISIFIVFVLVGIWHGVGWRFVGLGVFHAIGVIANHYYTIALKRVLGKEHFKTYMQNRLIRNIAVIMTFSYVTVSFIFFMGRRGEILRAVDLPILHGWLVR